VLADHIGQVSIARLDLARASGPVGFLEGVIIVSFDGTEFQLIGGGRLNHPASLAIAIGAFPLAYFDKHYKI
jgi:hypothetical protein